MGKQVQTFFKEFLKSKQRMARYIPETIKGFMSLYEKTSQPGALDKKQKGLIAVGIAVAQPCTACIYLHVQQAVEAGATVQEVMEAAGVAVVMGGGPAFAHIAEVLKTFEALEIKI